MEETSQSRYRRFERGDEDPYECLVLGKVRRTIEKTADSILSYIFDPCPPEDKE